MTATIIYILVYAFFFTVACDEYCVPHGGDEVRGPR